MTRDIAHEEPLDDVEALIRLAGDYVQPSDDLRPRVLEAARAVRRDQQAQRHILQLAAVLLVMAGCLAGLGNRMASRSAETTWLSGVTAGAVRDGSRGDAGWETVESFTQVRRQQARLLRLAL